MPIYVLTPNHPEDPRWKGNYNYEFIVRAEHQEMARDPIYEQFGEPWDSTKLVTCSGPVEDPPYPEEGPREILKTIRTK